MQKTSALPIAVVIPFKNKAPMTWDSVQSFFRHGPAVQEMLLISNNSDPEEVEDIKRRMASLPEKHKAIVRLVEYNHPFNYQKINNWGIAQTTSDVVLMLNNDVELTKASEGLFEHMYELCRKKDIGLVGCVLLYGDAKTIQHGGVYLVPGGTADHMYTGEDFEAVVSSSRGSKRHFDITKDQEVITVTGAVTMIERSKFEEVGGMDERFIICGGDVALGIALREKGYHNKLVGSDHGYALHKESKSRGHLPIPYNDFLWSYHYYIRAFEPDKHGDPCLGQYVVKEQKS